MSTIHIQHIIIQTTQNPVDLCMMYTDAEDFVHFFITFVSCDDKHLAIYYTDDDGKKWLYKFMYESDTTTYNDEDVSEKAQKWLKDLQVPPIISARNVNILRIANGNMFVPSFLW